MTLFAKRLSRQHSFELLLIVAFPIHVWAILVGLRNFQAVAERAANLTEGLGYLSYALLTALAESLLLLGFLYLLNFLLPRQYDAPKRVVQLGWLGTIFSLWMIVRQLVHLYGFNHPGAIADYVTSIGRPFVATLIGLAVLLGLIILSVGWPMLLIHRRAKFETALHSIFERLAPLSGLYLALDVIGVLIVLVRNFA
jgi:hypothetical protein